MSTAMFLVSLAPPVLTLNMVKTRSGLSLKEIGQKCDDMFITFFAFSENSLNVIISDLSIKFILEDFFLQVG